MSLIWGALLAVLAGILLLARSQRQRQALGLPNGEIFYQDLGGQPMKSKTLASRRYGLRGTPDCLIRTPEGIIPVELKKGARPPARGGVYPNHMIQVLAYCLLVAENYGEPVPYGLVLYGGREARKVVPTEENLAWLNDVAGRLRAARRISQIERSHHQVGRCAGCGVRERCGQSLVRL